MAREWEGTQSRWHTPNLASSPPSANSYSAAPSEVELRDGWRERVSARTTSPSSPARVCTGPRGGDARV